jgi:hypothetical protein
MMGHGEKRTRKQELAIAALLVEATVEAAAAKAGVCYRTLKGWLADLDFRAAYREARRAVVEGAVGRLQHATGKAVETLTRNLDCGNAAAENRAAVAILELALKGVELQDVLARLDELERRLPRPAAGKRGA